MGCAGAFTNPARQSLLPQIRQPLRWLRAVVWNGDAVEAIARREQSLQHRIMLLGIEHSHHPSNR
ncbi:MAG: MFS transporter [Akkermansiaceae bacterium]|nr:MFS transporter [Akkermansiaceae bacterium]